MDLATEYLPFALQFYQNEISTKNSNNLKALRNWINKEGFAMDPAKWTAGWQTLWKGHHKLQCQPIQFYLCMLGICNHPLKDIYQNVFMLCGW